MRSNIRCQGTMREIKAGLKILLYSHRYDFYSISTPRKVNGMDGHYYVYVNGNPLELGMEANTYAENKRMVQRFFKYKTEQRKIKSDKAKRIRERYKVLGRDI